MKHLEIKKKKFGMVNIDYKEYIKRPANENDFSELIKEDCIIYDEKEPNKPLILYFKFKDDTSEIRQAVQDIKYNTSARSGGLMSTSRIFGFDPATGIRKPFCSSTALSWDYPKQHKTVSDFGKKVADVYKEYLPNLYKNHEEVATKNVKEQWRISGTPFTSGIINKNNQLNYHFDSGNFKDVYSNMIVFKSNSAGGYLSIPEFDIGLQCADNTLVMFDGQKIMHGVTPIKFFSANAYRYSIVYYSLSALWKCEVLSDELAKVRNRRMRQERGNVKI